MELNRVGEERNAGKMRKAKEALYLFNFNSNLFSTYA